MAALSLAGRVYQVRLAFMDCDGIIFDANEAKSQAFAIAVDDYPAEAQAALVRHHKAFGGVSRYDKFEHFFTRIAPVEDVAAASARALERFGVASRRGYAPLAPIAEALAFAAALGGPERVYVVSGTDQTELRDVFEGKGIATQFAGICGSPARKPEHMQRLLSEHDCEPEHAVMVGDGRADFEAAQQLGMPFVFLAEMSEWADARRLLAPAIASEQAFWLDSWKLLLQLVLGGVG